jgi:putative membrane protein
MYFFLLDLSVTNELTLFNIKLKKMQRNLFDYLIISLKGMAMGAADAVPGVSGGTIAFISGIYEELIATISNVNFSLITTLKTEGIQATWKQVNGNFLLSLMAGIFVSFVSFMQLAKYLLEHHPILIWSFFFGLVLASIIYVAKQIEKWNLPLVVFSLIAAFLAYYITTLPSLANNESSIFLFISAAIAICAMILPGISGAFILVLLGAYKGLSTAFNELDIKKILIFIAGALIGLLSFSKLLKWLFNNHKNTTLAILTGFIIGSLNKIWPWKQTLTTRIDSKGIEVPVLQKSILPEKFTNLYQIDAQVSFAILLMLTGFISIIILEKIGSKTT